METFFLSLGKFKLSRITQKVFKKRNLFIFHHNRTIIASGIYFYMLKVTVQSSLIQMEDDEHSPNGEVSNRSKKLCQMIKKLLGTVLGNIGHGIGPTFPSPSLARGEVKGRQ